MMYLSSLKMDIGFILLSSNLLLLFHYYLCLHNHNYQLVDTDWHWKWTLPDQSLHSRNCWEEHYLLSETHYSESFSYSHIQIEDKLMEGLLCYVNLIDTTFWLLKGKMVFLHMIHCLGNEQGLNSYLRTLLYICYNLKYMSN